MSKKETYDFTAPIPSDLSLKELEKISVSDEDVRNEMKRMTTIRKIWNYSRLEKNFVVGNVVKLSFITPTGGESMWVEITDAEGYRPRTEFPNKKGFHEETFNTEFKGKLKNQPLDNTDYNYDDVVEFSLEHIIRQFE